MTRIPSIQIALVLGTLVLTAGASFVEADFPANSPWSFEAIASLTGGDVGKHASIAFNPSTGKPYISYYDETNGDLRLIYPHATSGNCGPNNEWYCEAPDTEGDVGQYSSIDYFVDSVTGYVKIGIAYHDATNDDLKVAIWSRFGFSYRWDVYTVDDGDGFYLDVGRDASLKFDSNGSAHIAYALSYQIGGVTAFTVSHASPVTSGGNCGEGAAAGKWQCDYALNGRYPSLDLTSSDSPVIALYSSADLGLCGKVGGSWSCATVDMYAGLSASLAIDQLGLPHIGYYDSLNGKLKYATWVGTAGNCGLNGGTYEYQCDIIDTIGDSQSQGGISIAVDLEGYPIIAYQEDSDPMGFPYLNVARPANAHGSLTGNCGPIVSWQCTTVDDATQGGGAGYLYEADFTAVGVAPNGLASIAYYEIDGYNNEGRLKYAAQVVEGLLFRDGFENGDTSAWSDVTP